MQAGKWQDDHGQLSFSLSTGHFLPYCEAAKGSFLISMGCSDSAGEGLDELSWESLTERGDSRTRSCNMNTKYKLFIWPHSLGSGPAQLTLGKGAGGQRRGFPTAVGTRQEVSMA